MKVKITIVRGICAGNAPDEVIPVGTVTAEVPIRDIDISLFEAIGNKIVELSEKVGTVIPAVVIIEFHVDSEYKDDIYKIADILGYEIPVIVDEADNRWRAKVTPTIVIDGSTEEISANEMSTQLKLAANKVFGNSYA